MAIHLKRGITVHNIELSSQMMLATGDLSREGASAFRSRVHLQYVAAPPAGMEMSFVGRRAAGWIPTKRLAHAMARSARPISSFLWNAIKLLWKLWTLRRQHWWYYAVWMEWDWVHAYPRWHARMEGYMAVKDADCIRTEWCNLGTVMNQHQHVVGGMPPTTTHTPAHPTWQ